MEDTLVDTSTTTEFKFADRAAHRRERPAAPEILPLCEIADQFLAIAQELLTSTQQIKGLPAHRAKAFVIKRLYDLQDEYWLCFRNAPRTHFVLPADHRCLPSVYEEYYYRLKTVERA